MDAIEKQNEQINSHDDILNVASNILGDNILNIPNTDIYISETEFKLLTSFIDPDPLPQGYNSQLAPTTANKGEVNNGGLIDYYQQNPSQLKPSTENVTNLNINQPKNDRKIDPWLFVAGGGVMSFFIMGMTGLMIIANNSASSQLAANRKQLSEDYDKLLATAEVVGQKRSINICLFALKCPEGEQTTPKRQSPQPVQPASYTPLRSVPQSIPQAPVANVSKADLDQSRQYINQWKAEQVSAYEARQYLNWLETTVDHNFPPIAAMEIAYSEIYY